MQKLSVIVPYPSNFFSTTHTSRALWTRIKSLHIKLDFYKIKIIARKTTLEGVIRPKNRQNDTNLIIFPLSRRPQGTHGYLGVSWEAKNPIQRVLNSTIKFKEDQLQKTSQKIAFFDRIWLLFRSFLHLIFSNLNGRAQDY